MMPIEMEGVRAHGSTVVTGGGEKVVVIGAARSLAGHLAYVIENPVSKQVRVVAEDEVRDEGEPEIAEMIKAAESAPDLSSDTKEEMIRRGTRVRGLLAGALSVSMAEGDGLLLGCVAIGFYRMPNGEPASTEAQVGLFPADIGSIFAIHAEAHGARPSVVQMKREIVGREKLN